MTTKKLTANPEIMRLHNLLANAINLDQLPTEQATMVITDACTTTGHRPKVDKPYEMKQPWQRGCRCGRQEFA